MATFKTTTENECTALTNYFNECGIKATRKGLVVKAEGEDNIIDYLYHIFVVNTI